MQRWPDTITSTAMEAMLDVPELRAILERAAESLATIAMRPETVRILWSLQSPMRRKIARYARDVH